MEDQQQFFDDDLWKGTYPKLYYFAILITKSKGLSKEDAKDFVQEAIKRFLTRERNWDSEKTDLLHYLKGVIRSIASHHVKSAYIVRRQNEIKDKNGDSINPVNSTESTEANAQESLERDDLEQFLWNEAGEDENIKLVLLCLSEENRRSEIADELNIPVTEVDNILKRIRRSTKKYLEQNKN